MTTRKGMNASLHMHMYVADHSFVFALWDSVINELCQLLELKKPSKFICVATSVVNGTVFNTERLVRRLEDLKQFPTSNELKDYAYLEALCSIRSVDGDSPSGGGVCGSVRMSLGGMSGHKDPDDVCELVGVKLSIPMALFQEDDRRAMELAYRVLAAASRVESVLFGFGDIGLDITTAYGNCFSGAYAGMSWDRLVQQGRWHIMLQESALPKIQGVFWSMYISDHYIKVAELHAITRRLNAAAGMTSAKYNFMGKRPAVRTDRGAIFVFSDQPVAISRCELNHAHDQGKARLLSAMLHRELRKHDALA